MPVLTILISGLISLTICVGSNSSGDGCNFIINFLLYFVTTLQIIEYQNSFVLELIVISVSCFIGGYAQWFIILPRIINKYWN